MKKSLYVIMILIICVALMGCSTPTTTNNDVSNSDVSEARIANPISDFEYDIDNKTNQCWITKYIGESTTVIIPENIQGYPVTLMGSLSFMNSNIQYVDIPDTVEKICNSAFCNCKELTTVKIGNGTKYIENQAFENCVSLKNLTLSKNLLKIGTNAFRYCESLETVFIPKTVETWGMEAFYGCPLSSLTFDNGIKSIGSYACFWGSTFKEITIPLSIEKLGEYAFHDNLEKVVFLGNAPTTLGKQPFGTKATIYYKKGTSGWENTNLKDIYKLIAQ